MDNLNLNYLFDEIQNNIINFEEPSTSSNSTLVQPIPNINMCQENVIVNESKSIDIELELYNLLVEWQLTDLVQTFIG